MMNGNGQAQGREPVERIVDLFVHMPIGFAVMAWKRVPEFVGQVPNLVGGALSKSCAQVSQIEETVANEVRKARMIGQVAVTFGGRQLRREVDARLRDARQAAGGVASFLPGAGAGGSNGAATQTVTAATTPTEPVSPPSPATPRAGARPAAKPTGARKAAKAPAAAAPPASAADLPIREYDGLSASQVVSRLTGLTPGELRAVRDYEAASRGRRTVLQAIDKLLG